MKKFKFDRPQIEKGLARAEQTLNLIGYIPMVSILSAAVRSFGGKCQIIIGIASCIVFYIRSCFASSKRELLLGHCGISLSYVFHGLSNLLRGCIEAVPCLSLLLCLPYDRLLHMRFKYGSEFAPPRSKQEDDNVIDIS